MNDTLWIELDDRQAEKAGGGAGIGQAVSDVNQSLKDQAENLGYQNITKLLKNTGVIIGPNGAKGFPYGQFVSDYTDYLKG